MLRRGVLRSGWVKHSDTAIENILMPDRIQGCCIAGVRVVYLIEKAYSTKEHVGKAGEWQ